VREVNPGVKVNLWLVNPRVNLSTEQSALKGSEFDSRSGRCQVVGMGDKQSQYVITNTKVNSAFRVSGGR